MSPCLAPFPHPDCIGACGRKGRRPVGSNSRRGRGICGVPMRSAYNAAKHGLIGYHDALRGETAHQGLKVLVAAPGRVRTNVSKNALTATGAIPGVSDSVIDNCMDPTTAAAQEQPRPPIRSDGKARRRWLNQTVRKQAMRPLHGWAQAPQIPRHRREELKQGYFSLFTDTRGKRLCCAEISHAVKRGFLSHP